MPENSIDLHSLTGSAGEWALQALMAGSEPAPGRSRAGAAMAGNVQEDTAVAYKAQ